MKKQIRPGFGWCPNNIINHPEISLKAKGLWLYLNSKPEKWEYTIEGTSRQTKDGRTSIKSAEQELVEFGLLRVNQSRETGKFSKNEFILHDTVSRFSDDGKTDDGKTDDGKTDDGKSTTSNKDLVKKKKKERLSKKELEYIVDHLNSLANRRFRLTDKTKKIILAREKDHGFEKIKQVIEFKIADWKGTKMERYIRPETIFLKSTVKKIRSENRLEELKSKL